MLHDLTAEDGEGVVDIGVGVGEADQPGCRPGRQRLLEPVRETWVEDLDRAVHQDQRVKGSEFSGLLQELVVRFAWVVLFTGENERVRGAVLHDAGQAALCEFMVRATAHSKDDHDPPDAGLQRADAGLKARAWSPVWGIVGRAGRSMLNDAAMSKLSLGLSRMAWRIRRRFLK